jgi:hypothetical protein
MTINIHADKFRMPCFGKAYWFYEDGRVYKNDIEVPIDKVYTDCYSLLDEQYNWHYVSKKEIVQYYNHLMQSFAAKLSKDTEVLIIRQHKYGSRHSVKHS